MATAQPPHIVHDGDEEEVAFSAGFWGWFEKPANMVLGLDVFGCAQLLCQITFDGFSRTDQDTWWWLAEINRSWYHRFRFQMHHAVQNETWCQTKASLKSPMTTRHDPMSQHEFKSSPGLKNGQQTHESVSTCIDQQVCWSPRHPLRQFW